MKAEEFNDAHVRQRAFTAWLVVMALRQSNEQKAEVRFAGMLLPSSTCRCRVATALCHCTTPLLCFIPLYSVASTHLLIPTAAFLQPNVTLTGGSCLRVDEQVFLATKDVRLVSMCVQRWHRWSFRREWVVFAARLKR